MLILASKSPRRIEIFKRLNFSFKSIPAEINENIVSDIPFYIPCRLSELKAEAVALIYPRSTVVGVDTVVIYRNNVMGKPKDLVDAENFLLKLSGEWHFVISGVCILNISKNLKYLFSDVSKVKFKELDIKIIRNYLSKINPLDKAGGYAIQEYSDMLIEEVVGSKENIIGFPTEKFLDIMKIVQKNERE